MQAISPKALPLPATPKRGNNIWATKLDFIYVKRAKARNSVISYLRVPRVRSGQCKQFHARFYPSQQPRKGQIAYGQRNRLLSMLNGPRLKTVSYRTLGFPECGMSNASNFTRCFTPASNPERGNNIWETKWAFIYVKRAMVKNSVISYIRVPRVRNGQCKQFHARLYPCQQPRKG